MYIIGLMRWVRARVIYGLVTMVLVLAPVTHAQQIRDVDEIACKKAKGLWMQPQMQGIPGDGTSHVKVVVTGPAGYELIGAHAWGLRQNLEGQPSFTCLLNPKQPPTVENSEDRRCTPPGNDMSVEQCKVDGSTLTCEYVNQKNAPNKLVWLSACFKEVIP